MMLVTESSKHHLSKLSASNFRNLRAIDISFSNDINIFVGDNGHGKTNTLEAIALACSLKPMQSLQNSDLITAHEEHAHITAQFEGTPPYELMLAIFAKGKKAQLNQKPLTNARTLAQFTPLVSFIPSELSMINGSSALRRRALDQAASALFLDHINALRAFEKVLTHRNSLLKSWPIDHAVLKSFTDLYIREAAQVIYYRTKALHELQSYFATQCALILGPNNYTSLSYSCDEETIDTWSIGDISGYLLNRYRHYEKQELYRKVSLFGPHLDTVNFFINGLNAQKCASRGQSRALIIAFKLAQILAIIHYRNHTPIIILDDIVSELDEEKKDNLMSLIIKFKTQAFFSATNMQCFGQKFSCGCVFSLTNGALESA